MQRREELGARCFVARGMEVCEGGTRVVGIGIEQLNGQSTHVDACLLEKNAWTEEDQLRLEELQAAGLFGDVRISRSRDVEYPDARK